jgi:hypothetical protein
MKRIQCDKSCTNNGISFNDDIWSVIIPHLTDCWTTLFNFVALNSHFHMFMRDFIHQMTLPHSSVDFLHMIALSDWDRLRQEKSVMYELLEFLHLIDLVHHFTQQQQLDMDTIYMYEYTNYSDRNHCGIENLFYVDSKKKRVIPLIEIENLQTITIDAQSIADATEQMKSEPASLRRDLCMHIVKRKKMGWRGICYDILKDKLSHRTSIPGDDAENIVKNGRPLLGFDHENFYYASITGSWQAPPRKEAQRIIANDFKRTLCHTRARAIVDSLVKGVPNERLTSLECPDANNVK